MVTTWIDSCHGAGRVIVPEAVALPSPEPVPEPEALRSIFGPGGGLWPERGATSPTARTARRHGRSMRHQEGDGASLPGCDGESKRGEPGGLGGPVNLRRACGW